MRLWISKPLASGAAGLTLLLVGSSVLELAAQTADPPWVAASAAALNTEVQKLRQGLIVYEDADSGYNHGTFSGFFGTTSAIPKLSIDTGCVPAGNPPTGCSTDPNVQIRVSWNGHSIYFPATYAQ